MKRPTDFLLIDVSNSFTKIAFASRSRVQQPKRVATRRFTAATLRRILRKRDVTIVACSVVPAKNQDIISARGGRKLLWLTPEVRLNVRIDYPKPETIGGDRLANAVAVADLYGVPAIVVDFGTAVTFDVVSAQGAYIGGVIAPGLEAMTNFLYQRTALLPRITLREPLTAIGRSTRNAMLAGAIIGYRGLVREILHRIIAEKFSGKEVHIIATGGYAHLIAKELSEISAVRSNLTLEGLRLVGCMNQ